MNPALLRVALLQGRARPRVRSGSRPFPARGDGFEISEVRAYAQGDDPRRIDWAASARSSELQVKVVVDERALLFAAIVDTSASMRLGRRTRLLDAGFDALDLWCDAVARDDRTARIDGVQSESTTLRGIAAAAFLRERREPEQVEVEAALRIARASLPRDSALLVISDFLDDVADDTLAALGAHVDATALIARDPWYDGLPLRGFVRVRDVETGAARKIFLGRIERARYREATMRRESRLIDRLHYAGWRAAPLVERDGRGSLFAAFGLQALHEASG